MQRNRPPVHGGPAAPTPYYSPNPNPNPAYHQYPYYPQPIISNPYLHHHHHQQQQQQQLYITNGFNSRIQLSGAVPNPAMSVYPYAESSNLYNAPPQFGLAHAYPQAVASAPISTMMAAASSSEPSVMEAASAPSVMEAASEPSALAAAVAAVMAAYRPEFNSAQITLNPQINAVTVQPNVAETFVAANPKPTFGVTIQPNVTETFVFVAENPKPTFPKKIKKVKISKKAQIQSPPGWCEICKIDCTSEAVLLYSHISGKKHKKNLEKLASSSRTEHAIIPPASTSEITTREYPDKSTTTINKNAKRIATANADLETKKKKMLESGATTENVRMCDVCKVVCNSETVLKLHLVGSRHAAAMMKKHASEITIVAATSKGENSD